MTAIPNRVLQTSRADFPNAAKWARIDAGCELILHRDEDAEALVREHYPEMLPTYRALGHAVERADLWRYLAVHRFGGVYADADVVPLVRLDAWLATFGWTHGADGFSAERLLVCGIEFPRPEGGNPLQLAQWTFASTAPGHPLLLGVAQEVVVRAGRIPYSKANVCERTGPGAWTGAILRFLREHGQAESVEALVADAEPRGAYIPFATGDAVWGLLVLPYRAFGFHPGHGDDVVKEPRAQHLVHHEFRGSWR